MPRSGDEGGAIMVVGPVVGLSGARDATALAEGQRAPAPKTAFMNKFALGRIGQPRADIAEAIAHLRSDAFGSVTTRTPHPDGGSYPAAWIPRMSPARMRQGPQAWSRSA